MSNTTQRAKRMKAPKNLARTTNHQPDHCAVDQQRHLRNRLMRLVCSDPWERDVRVMISTGAVAFRPARRGGVDEQHLELNRRKVYPPGGPQSLMRRCCHCRRQCPQARWVRSRRADPQKDGSLKVTWGPWRSVCCDCFYVQLLDDVERKIAAGEMENGSIPWLFRLGSSPGFDTRYSQARAVAEGLSVRGCSRRRFIGSYDEQHKVFEQSASEDGTIREWVIEPPEES